MVTTDCPEYHSNSMRYRGVDSGCELVGAEPVEAVWLAELDGDI